MRPRGVTISEPALQWIEREAKRISADFGPAAAQAFKKRINTAILNIAAFPHMTARGAIPGSRTVTIFKRTILTLVEREGEVVVAAARTHWQDDSHAPHEVHAADADDEESIPADTRPPGGFR